MRGIGRITGAVLFLSSSGMTNAQESIPTKTLVYDPAALQQAELRATRERVLEFEAKCGGGEIPAEDLKDCLEIRDQLVVMGVLKDE